MVLKFCANISFMFAESGHLLERYALAKKAGFRGVECAYPTGFTFEEVLAAKREANIAQVLLNTCNGMCWILSSRFKLSASGSEIRTFV